MDDIRFDHVEQTLIVGDDDGGRLISMHLVHPFRYDAHGVNIKAGIGLVEDAQLRFEHRHLEDFIAFLLTTREAFVHTAAGQVGVHAHQPAFFPHKGHELGCFQRFESLISTLGIDGCLHEVGHAHSRNLHRILEREEEPFMRTVFRLHLQQVLSIEDSHAVGHFIERITCKYGTER